MLPNLNIKNPNLALSHHFTIGMGLYFSSKVSIEIYVIEKRELKVTYKYSFITRIYFQKLF